MQKKSHEFHSCLVTVCLRANQNQKTIIYLFFYPLITSYNPLSDKREIKAQKVWM